MTARLRVLFVAPDKHLLVIDRMDSLTRDQAAALVTASKTPATEGVLVFPFEVEIPGDEPDRGVKVYPDEIAAIERLHAVVNGAPVAELRRADADAIRLLVDRAREAIDN